MHAVNITPFELMDFVVIVGAGPIGLLTLLAARQRGAGSIIVTDRDPHRLDVARRLGADQAIDVGRTDPVAAVEAATDGRGADAVFEAVGIAATVAQSIAVARPGGQVTWIGNSAPEVELPMQAARDPRADGPRLVRLRRRVRAAPPMPWPRAGSTPGR